MLGYPPFLNGNRPKSTYVSSGRRYSLNKTLMIILIRDYNIQFQNWMNFTQQRECFSSTNVLIRIPNFPNNLDYFYYFISSKWQHNYIQRYVFWIWYTLVLNLCNHQISKYRDDIKLFIWFLNQRYHLLHPPLKRFHWEFGQSAIWY